MLAALLVLVLSYGVDAIFEDATLKSEASSDRLHAIEKALGKMLLNGLSDAEKEVLNPNP